MSKLYSAIEPKNKSALVDWVAAKPVPRLAHLCDFLRVSDADLEPSKKYDELQDALRAHFYNKSSKKEFKKLLSDGLDDLGESLKIHVIDTIREEGAGTFGSTQSYLDFIHLAKILDPRAPEWCIAVGKVFTKKDLSDLFVADQLKERHEFALSVIKNHSFDGANPLVWKSLSELLQDLSNEKYHKSALPFLKATDALLSWPSVLVPSGNFEALRIAQLMQQGIESFLNKRTLSGALLKSISSVGEKISKSPDPLWSNFWHKHKSHDYFESSNEPVLRAVQSRWSKHFEINSLAYMRTTGARVYSILTHNLNSAVELVQNLRPKTDSKRKQAESPFGDIWIRFELRRGSTQTNSSSAGGGQDKEPGNTNATKSVANFDFDVQVSGMDPVHEVGLRHTMELLNYICSTPEYVSTEAQLAWVEANVLNQSIKSQKEQKTKSITDSNTEQSSSEKDANSGPSSVRI